jgi:hypothetical protein
VPSRKHLLCIGRKAETETLLCLIDIIQHNFPFGCQDSQGKSCEVDSDVGTGRALHTPGGL